MRFHTVMSVLLIWDVTLFMLFSLFYIVSLRKETRYYVLFVCLFVVFFTILKNSVIYMLNKCFLNNTWMNNHVTIVSTNPYKCRICYVAFNFQEGGYVERSSFLLYPKNLLKNHQAQKNQQCWEVLGRSTFNHNEESRGLSFSPS